MSYAIIRNEKLTRAQAMGAYKHNERKTKNHSNKNIDSSKTELNYYLKKNELSYIKEFDKLRKENANHPIEKVGEEIRSSFVWGNDDKIIDRNKN